MFNEKRLDLQLFAGEGAGGDGGGEGAAAGTVGTAVGAERSSSVERRTCRTPQSGEVSADAGHQRLLELGIPADKIRKNRAYKLNAPAPKSAAAGQTRAPEQKPEQAAAAETNTEEKKTEAPTRLSWDEIMADPEYNKQMQATIQARLRTAKGAEEAMSKLTPALELLARKHGQDPANIDYDALVKSISDDGSYYEDKALEMGVSAETARKVDQQERDAASAQRDRQRTLEQQKFRQHIMRLEQQGEAMKQTFPGFDLRKELRNPMFARMTSPNVGISVQDAYYAVHRNELQTAAMQITAQKTAQRISNAIASGSRRPSENGTSGQAPSVTTFDYSRASKEQRDALKALIRSEAAHGRKVYPGSFPGK